MSNATAPGPVNTKDRTGIFGGSMHLRTPVKAVTIFAFDPPRLDAGCGGVDLHMGSFSMINGPAIIDVMRKVAANASGLAFKAAIKAINPSLAGLMEEFQALLQNMNNLGKNSCMMAHAVIDPMERSLAKSINGEGNSGAVKMGAFDDAMSGLTGYLKGANEYLQKAGKVNPKAGNGVVKAVVSSGATSILGIMGLPDSEDSSDPNSRHNRILYSLLGYQIEALPCSSQNESGTGRAIPKNPGSEADGAVICRGAPTLELDDLIKGGGPNSPSKGKPLSLYRCVNPDGNIDAADRQICTSMQVEDWSYQGLQGYVNMQLFGTASPTDITTVTSESIVGRTLSGESWKHTPAQRLFLKQIGVPLLPLLSKTSNNDHRYAIALDLTNHITSCMAAHLGGALYKAANLTRGSGYILGSEVEGRISTIRNDFMAQQSRCQSNEAVLKRMQEILIKTQLSNTNAR